MSLKSLSLFLLLSGLLVVGVFRDALWGGSLLAPLDIAPALFPKYRHVEPAMGGVPANHYIIDQLTYDLPLQKVIYDGIRAGEMPWWDPYTYGGRPLLADAHISGTDPFRLLAYSLLPFELAYNWTRILHSLLTGFGVFCLLQWLRCRAGIAIPLALAAQFAGTQAMFFGHPWIQASFVWYPFLWMVWTAPSGTREWLLRSLGGLLCAGLFYAGNLQSHTYVVLFAIVVLGARLSVRQPGWSCHLYRIFFAGLIGAALAAPVLLSEVELYVLGFRASTPGSPYIWASGLASLSAIFPWAMGTFRTLDIGRFIGATGLGFTLFIGSAAFLLAMKEFFHTCATLAPARTFPRRVALGVVILYLGLCSTPLINVFYHRLSGLAVLGLIVLAAFGVERLLSQEAPARRWGLATVSLTLLLLIGANAGAFLIYPRLQPRVMALVADTKSAALDEARELRVFQVENLPREVSVLNSETWLAALGLLALGGAFLTTGRSRQLWISAALVLNLISPVLFFQRFVPRQPIALWQRLLEGGPEQLRVAQNVGTGRLWDRPFETESAMHDQLFPNALSALQKVHTLRGYAALVPHTLATLQPDELATVPSPLIADWLYSSSARGATTGTLTPMNPTPDARFSFNPPDPRSVTVTRESLNTVTLALSPGLGTTLVRTDTAYPGWSATVDGKPANLVTERPWYSTLQVPAEAHQITLTYRPRFLTAGLGLAALAGVFTAISVGIEAFPRRKPDPVR